MKLFSPWIFNEIMVFLELIVTFSAIDPLLISKSGSVHLLNEIHTDMDYCSGDQNDKGRKIWGFISKVPKFYSPKLYFL